MVILMLKEWLKEFCESWDVGTFGPSAQGQRQVELCEFKVHRKLQASKSYTVRPCLKNAGRWGSLHEQLNKGQKEQPGSLLIFVCIYRQVPRVG